MKIILITLFLLLGFVQEGHALKRYYVCDVIGDGSESNPYRPAVADHNVNYVAEIESDSVTGIPTKDWSLVMVSGNKHVPILADPRCDSLPDFPLDGKVSAMHAATRSAMATALQNRGIGLDLGGADGFRDVIRGIGRVLNPNFNENNFDISE